MANSKARLTRRALESPILDISYPPMFWITGRGGVVPILTKIKHLQPLLIKYESKDQYLLIKYFHIWQVQIKLCKISCMIWSSNTDSMIHDHDQHYHLRILITTMILTMFLIDEPWLTSSTYVYFSLSPSDFVEWAPGRPVFKHATKDRLAMMMIMMTMMISPD